MRIRRQLDSFRISPAAVYLLVPTEIDAQQGRLPPSAFNWQWQDQARSAVLAPDQPLSGLREWAALCALYGIRALLLLADGDRPEEDEAVDALADLGIEVLPLRPDNLAYQGCDDEADLSLQDRLMLVDEAVFVPYFALASARLNTLDVWAACSSMEFWLSYGDAIDAWAPQPRVQQTWGPRLAALHFGSDDQADRPQSACVVSRATQLVAGKALAALFAGRPGPVDHLCAVVLATGLPFLRDEYALPPTPSGMRRVGALPGMAFNFAPGFAAQGKAMGSAPHVSALTAAVTAAVEQQLATLKRLFAGCTAGNTVRASGAETVTTRAALKITADTATAAGGLAAATVIGTAYFSPGDLTLDVWLPVSDTQAVQGRMQLHGVAHLPLRFSLDPAEALGVQRQVRLGLRVPVVQFLAEPVNGVGSHPNDTSLAVLQALTITLGERRIECDIELLP